MSAYYNEIDPKAAATLRELINKGLIAPGDVDERSIEDVSPIELAGYTQRHFFAGFGVWSYSLRGAGWPDDREVVTMSCPCQPFSAAGKGAGFADERHLWPAGSWHIRLGRPCPVFGEQVASSDGLAWLDTVSADLEAASYSIAAIDLCAAGVGAPHIRQRLYWMAHPGYKYMRRTAGANEAIGRRPCFAVAGQGVVSELANTYGGNSSTEGLQRSGEYGLIAQDCGSGELAYPGGTGSSELGGRWNKPQGSSSTGQRYMPGPTNGHWRDADWLLCRDGRWRPVEPCTSPLAHGASQRVGRLRGYGNAIVAPVAQAFIEAVMAVAVCT